MEVRDLPDHVSDVWLVDNRPGSGRTVLPEDGDAMFSAGTLERRGDLAELCEYAGGADIPGVQDGAHARFPENVQCPRMQPPGAVGYVRICNDSQGEHAPNGNTIDNLRLRKIQVHPPQLTSLLAGWFSFFGDPVVVWQPELEPHRQCGKQQGC